MNAFSLKSGTSQGFLLSLLLFNPVLKILDSAITHEKEIKCFEIIKEKPNINLFVEEYNCIESFKESTKKLLAIIIC